MKKYFVMAVFVLFVVTPAIAGVVGTKHDMVFSGFASSPVGNTEVCIFCHTPHGAQTSVTQAPLWNNTAATSVNATMYTGGSNPSTVNFAFTDLTINATDARLCLACHDSGVGMPVNQPNTGDMSATGLLMSANALLSLDMSNDHPIGMNLTANPELIDPGIHTIADIIGATGFNENPFYGGAAVNTMWCSTCHNVHENAPLKIPFLRMSNVGSAMCKACHKR